VGEGSHKDTGDKKKAKAVRFEKQSVRGLGGWGQFLVLVGSIIGSFGGLPTNKSSKLLGADTHDGWGRFGGVVGSSFGIV
jgi:hypothetical protein